MPKQREYRWYVKPLDGHTNGVFGRTFEADSFGHQETTEGEQPLYEVDRQMVDYLNKSKSDLHIIFKVYVQEGRGQIRPSNLDKRRKPAKPMARAYKPTKRVAERTTK